MTHLLEYLRQTGEQNLIDHAKLISHLNELFIVNEDIRQNLGSKIE